MDVLTENFAIYGKGFLGTLQLTVYASSSPWSWDS